MNWPEEIKHIEPALRDSGEAGSPTPSDKIALSINTSQEGADERFDQRTPLELASAQFIGEEALDDSYRDEYALSSRVLSPISKSDYWTIEQLHEAIERLNTDPAIRNMTKTFRMQRRRVFGKGEVQFGAY